MGYIYSHSGKLVCDFCNTPGARKVPCPFGYCPAVAACPACRKEFAQQFSRAHHHAHGCEANHNAFVAAKEEKDKLLAAGEFVLCAAVNESGDRSKVRVWFRNGRRDERCVLMPCDFYSNLYMTRSNPTLSWFEAQNGGPFPPAPLPAAY